MQHIFRNIAYLFRRFPLASMSNFLGLVLAMMAFFGFLTKTRIEMDYNTDIADRNTIFRVDTYGAILSDEETDNALVPVPLAYALKGIDGVEDVGLLSVEGSEALLTTDKTAITTKYYDGYAEFLTFWNKDIKPSFNKKSKEADYVCVPTSLAESLFGTENAIGKEFIWHSEGKSFKGNIACVYKDFNLTSSPKNGIYRYGSNEDSDQLGNLGYYAYIKIADRNDIAKVEKAINDSLSGYNLGIPIKFKLRWDTTAHFSGIAPTDNGNNPVLILLALSAIVAIIITNVNFINFSLAETPVRMKGANIRRVIGASKWDLRISIITENVVMSFAAFILSMIAMFCLDSYFPDDINPLHNVRFLIYTFIASVIIGIGSGLYPAFHVTKFTPSIAIKGTFTLSRKARFFRNFHTGVQFTCSFALVGFLLLMLLELHHVHSTDYGFDKDNIVLGSLASKEANDNKLLISQKIKELPEVENTSISLFKLGTQDMYIDWTREKDGKKVNFTVMPVDWKYMRTMGIGIIKGRDFQKDDKGVFICNEAFMKSYPWVKVGHSILSGYDAKGNGMNYKIIGECSNIHFSSFRKETDKALGFMIVDEDYAIHESHSNTINIKLKENCNREEAFDKIRKVYSSITHDNLFVLQTWNDQIPAIYEDEIEFINEIEILALVYILITLIGTLTQTLFECEYRRKEIAIRKVFGASITEIITMLCRHYVPILTVSFLFSTIVIYSMGEIALNGFKYTASYLWLCYPLSFLIVFILVICTIVINGWKTANELPSKNIANE